MTPEEEKRLAEALCRERLACFVMRSFSVVNPGETVEWNWHLDCICDHLEAVYRGEIPRLIVNLPPRSLKSFIFSIAGPAWKMGHDASEKFMVGSHTLRPLAAKLSTDFRRLIESDWYKDIFPETKLQKSTETEITTTQNGHRLAFAVGQSPTGMGCNIGVLDDVNRPDEALSDVIRVKTNEWIDQTFMSRFNDYRTAKVICVMQRVHTDDATGHLLSKGGYFHLKLPAEGRIPKRYDISGKRYVFMPGLMFPARLPQNILDEKRNDLGEYAYAGQFLQEPVPIGGGLIKDTWVQWYDNDEDFDASAMNIYILCDPAGVGDVPGKNTAKRKKSDWTAFIVVGLSSDHNYYLLDMVRDKFNPTERIQALFDLHKKWNVNSGKPPKVGYESYGLQADLHYINEKMKKDNYRFALEPLGGTMGKNDRILRVVPDLENGRWFFPKFIQYTDKRGISFDLVNEMISGEMRTFPFSKHDDCLDALSRIYDEEMSANFPKVKAPRTSANNQPTNWMEY